ncbi:hypothetical protein CYLTODRAFT_418605 [Cylindrobasidium torrendii FP15055 ss-10]|uniref:Uncharacterized protein n=1 Tax=Cylindrobasidium torrendii FP15055 ss-10 TaxID=1314674 RepID=A0A0D7BNF3_9AGAR|nr:hypothetical protein CYLTODRAFT_418605 [Cylindrobasidium torrendii FP15055 ss-10]
MDNDGQGVSNVPQTPASDVGFFYPPPSPTETSRLQPSGKASHGNPDAVIPPMPQTAPHSLNLQQAQNADLASQEKFGRPLPSPPSSPPPIHPSAAPETSRPRFSHQQWFAFAWIPLIPVLSAIYTLIGAGIFSRPVALAGGAAIGGLILDIPLTAIIYFLLCPRQTTPTPATFFDDASSVSTGKRCLTWQNSLCCLLGVLVGALTAPLGAACLSQNTRHAVESGALGGFVLFAVVLFVGGIAFIALWARRRPKGVRVVLPV